MCSLRAHRYCCAVKVVHPRDAVHANAGQATEVVQVREVAGFLGVFEKMASAEVGSASPVGDRKVWSLQPQLGGLPDATQQHHADAWITGPV